VMMGWYDAGQLKQIAASFGRAAMDQRMKTIGSAFIFQDAPRAKIKEWTQGASVGHHSI